MLIKSRDARAVGIASRVVSVVCLTEPQLMRSRVML